MNKQLSLILLFASISTTLFSQQKTFKIDYGFHVSDEILNIDPNKETDEAKKDLAMIALLASMFQEDGQPIAEVWVNDDFLRVYSNGPLQKTLQITNKTTQESFILYPDYNQYTASSPASDKMLDLGNKLAFAGDLPVSFVEGRHKTIAGIDCKLAQIVIEAEGQKPTPIDIWYSEEIPKVYWGEYGYLEKLPGAALEITTLGIGINALEISTADTDPSLFQVPENYTLVEYIMDYGLGETSTVIAENRILYNDEEGYRWGIKDSSGNPITPPLYISINPYQDGYSIATNENYRYGTLDMEGKEVLPFTYEYLEYNPEEKTYTYLSEGLYGLLNQHGATIISSRYKYLSAFKNGHAVFSQNDKNGLIDSKGTEVVPASEGYIVDNSHSHFIRVNDQMEAAIYTVASGQKTSEDYELISMTEIPNLFIAFKKERYGCIDQDGKTVIPFQYTSMSMFEDGVALVSDANTKEHFQINTKGERIDTPNNK